MPLELIFSDAVSQVPLTAVSMLHAMCSDYMQQESFNITRFYHIMHNEELSLS
jgi:hypothetical protein